MSGDVQPRKRKDKKKKKDDLGIDEPRGTAAALGEGDVFMHSHHDHGTGGHWCAKVIFFSLLAVLITLIGLIILENRGLSELEANSVESRYSGVLDGWLEEDHDDDHHDEHTLELHHHDDEDDEDDDHSAGLDHHDDHDKSQEDDEEQSQEADQDDDDEKNQDDTDADDDDDREQDDDDYERDEDEDTDESREINDENNDDEDAANSQQDEEADDDISEEQNVDAAEDEDEVEESSYKRYYRSTENQANDDDNDDVDDDNSVENYNDDQQDEINNDSQENDDDDLESEDEQKNHSEENDVGEKSRSNINEENDDKNSDENDQDEDDEDHADHNDHDEDDDVELEHIEDEVFDEDVSTEAPAKKSADSEEAAPVADDDDDDEVELLEPDELDELPEELPIPLPKGKPLVEVEEPSSTEKPQDTLADEEEYERQQEALRREKEQASQGMWLKVVVGGALLVATQAVLRRATAPRENEDEVNVTREDTPLSDRRMTLISDPVPPPVTPKQQEASRPVAQKDVVIQESVVKSTSSTTNEEEEEIVLAEDKKQVAAENDNIDRELYSDEEEDVEEEDDIEEEKEELPKPISKPIAPAREPTIKETPKPIEKKEPPKVVEKEPTPEAEEDDDDVEIIEEEDIGDDVEEEEEEDISDVDDAELLNRLEAKYGRLPELETHGRKKDGGDSIEDEWPGEPSDAYWRDELDRAERELRQGEWSTAAQRASASQLQASARARFIVAQALDSAAEAKRDNGLLSKAVAAYLNLLKMNEKLTDKKLIEITDRALDRMKFRGNYLGTEPLYRLLIRRFPDDPTHRNNLTVSFLMANRVDLAEEEINETLKRWPNDRLALAHHGFILKTLHNKLEEAVDVFTKALEGDNGPANEPRFYYHLGDSLLLLGRFKEAHEVHKRGAKLGHFLSPAQRSLYNVERLKSQPWWDVEKTPYAGLARALEKSWKEILKEGRAAQSLYEKEKEGLKERGEWSQLDLFVRGREVPNRCTRAPVTCGIVKSEVAASGCRRGQVKFSSMEAGTHVRPHVGPTNCRLRMHLGLSNTKDTYIRVDQETRQWQTGKVLMFDDSFEHEVWHNGTGARLVLIVDVWHPELTRAERAQLPAI